MMIVWDEPKRPNNLAKHGLDFADLDEMFFHLRWSSQRRRTATWRSVGFRTAPSLSSSPSWEPKAFRLFRCAQPAVRRGDCYD